MKLQFLFSALIALLIFSSVAFAENEERDVPAFSKIALRIDAKVYIEQGDKQSIEIVAKPATLNDLITEVKNRTLQIRFPANYLFKKIDPGKIEIFITIPQVDGLSVSGSGDVMTEELETRILELITSGSGKIVIEKLKSERISATISGSGNIVIKDSDKVVDDLSVSISGSGNLDASRLEARDVKVKIAGSGNCLITSNGSINARIAGSGNVEYKGNPAIESSIAGSGKVKKM